MKDCLFCKLKDNKIPAEIIYQNDWVVSFLDVQPRAPGHAVVIPRNHYPTLIDMPEGEIGHLFSSIKTVAQLLSDKLQPDGLTIGINQGLASGQTIDHIHVHLMPRFLNDNGGSIHGIVNNKPSESLAEISEKLRLK